MAPKKKARIGQKASATSGVADDSLFDTAGEDNHHAITLPDSSTPEQITSVPTSTEGTTIPPAGMLVPPPAPASSSGISDGDLRGAIQMLTPLVASQAQRSNAAPSSSIQQGDSTSSRVNRFLQLDPPVVMRASEIEGVELAAYRLKGVAYSWFELWEDSREEGSPPVRWRKFADAFVDHFLPAETRATRAVEFKNLKQGRRSVWEYHMESARLSKYAIHMLPTMEARVSTTALNSEMNYGKMVVFAQATESRKLKNIMEREGNKKARSTGNMGESLGGGRSLSMEDH
uniref:Uncharacterized protein LOC104229429 n=1 Tax=Nicotiana sylvestris TaxID=4096 RepID=A0A1U7WSU8_NICSY|nr:PREDICTED: uncharacterized protein LOC104229429 [Nicotiana sylvestris]